MSDDKVGSTPRFKPGSKAKPSQMEVDDDEVTEVAVSDAGGTDPGSSQHTPLHGVLNQVKRKAGEVFFPARRSSVKRSPSHPFN